MGSLLCPFSSISPPLQEPGTDSELHAIAYRLPPASFSFISLSHDALPLVLAPPTADTRSQHLNRTSQLPSPSPTRRPLRTLVRLSPVPPDPISLHPTLNSRRTTFQGSHSSSSTLQQPSDTKIARSHCNKVLLLRPSPAPSSPPLALAPYTNPDAPRPPRTQRVPQNASDLMHVDSPRIQSLSFARMPISRRNTETLSMLRRRRRRRRFLRPRTGTRSRYPSQAHSNTRDELERLPRLSPLALDIADRPPSAFDPQLLASAPPKMRSLPACLRFPPPSTPHHRRLHTLIPPLIPTRKSIHIVLCRVTSYWRLEACSRNRTGAEDEDGEYLEASRPCSRARERMIKARTTTNTNMNTNSGSSKVGRSGCFPWSLRRVRLGWDDGDGTKAIGRGCALWMGIEYQGVGMDMVGGVGASAGMTTTRLDSSAR